MYLYNTICARFPLRGLHFKVFGMRCNASQKMNFVF